MFASSFRLNDITLNAVGFSEAPRTRCRVLHASVYTDLAGDSLYLEITVCLGVRNSSESSWHWFTDSFHWCINCNSVNGTVPSLSVTAAASVSVTVWLGAECKTTDGHGGRDLSLSQSGHGAVLSRRSHHGDTTLSCSRRRRRRRHKYTFNRRMYQAKSTPS